MLTTARADRCAQCSGKVIDMGDEMVCSSCGTVLQKMVIEPREDRRPQAIDYTTHALGSYLGPLDYGYEEQFSRGFSKTSSTYRYLKTISDHSYKEGTNIYTCAKLMERICEKLALPSVVMAQSVRISKDVMDMKHKGSGFTIAAISAFSIITACKVCGVTSVGVREVMKAHRALGHRVKPTSIIQMSIDSPVRPMARRAEEYLTRVAAHVPEIPALAGTFSAGYQARLLEVARRVLEIIDSTSRGGHNPCALAATSVYAAEVILARMEERKKRLTQSDLAACADVADYTVREQYGEIFRPRMEDIYLAIARASPSRTPTIQTHPAPLQHQVRLS
jgi:transcription initiation factor TFIIIB Brf1 subunit/transcription initiation factor TFIIB